MSDFIVALADLRRVGLGDFASRSILMKPTPLPYVKAKPGPRGGNSERLYSLRPLLLLTCAPSSLQLCAESLGLNLWR